MCNVYFSMLTRKKVIGLDDLLKDHYEQKEKQKQKEKKRGKAKKRKYDSDEDDSGKEALLTNIVNTCHHQALQFVFSSVLLVIIIVFLPVC